MRLRLESPNLYTIAWIAALPIERAAATALLDDRHDAPEGFHQHSSDENSYTWGRIGEHNIVIASLPAGVYGLASAATTALDLIRSLPYIRIGLLVGIGGGIARPDAGQDIRLGDVVVSQPDGTTGGVVQYDLGKAKAGGTWERKGSLDRPPLVLLNALASLQAEHEFEPSKVPDLLRAMLEAKPSMRRPKSDYTYQGAENDRLFESQHDHIGGSNCDKCDPTWEVKRDPRESTEPEIHYGIIASGNKLVKDAATRDGLSGDTGHQCLCVEMEAAGLMNRFPCLVIRGICDYADSHKNDRWQRYAAAAAAAFAVELLGFVPARELEATEKVAKAIQALKQKVDTVGTFIRKVDHGITLDRLPVVEEASFDSHAEAHNPTCLPGTRVQLLEDISHWIDSPNSKTIFWLDGMAGTGKSTISRTVAQRRHERGDLGASFFFKRGEIDRGNLTKLVPTLARQLASRISAVEFAEAVKKTLVTDPEIIRKAVAQQFQELIQEPLSKVEPTNTTPLSLVIVIDALDECEGQADIELLIELLSGVRSTSSLYVRVLVTSRPELPVRLGFRHFNDDSDYRYLQLQKIPSSTIELDISVFLDYEFANICKRFNSWAKEELRLPANWPGEADLKTLTIAASPLFIFAATICRFVEDSYLGDPRDLLQKVLETTSNLHTSRLAKTYSPVLEQQIINKSELERHEIIKSFRLVVGTIITLADPLSQRVLALLLDVDVRKVAARLEVLRSVLDVPDSLDLPVRLLHLSFRDYLVTEESEFRVNEELTHQNLAINCLRIMHGSLKENICDLPFPGACRSELDSQHIKSCIPPELQYACLYWVHHQIAAKHNSDNYQQIDDILKNHLLHWLEAMCLIGRSGDILDMFGKLAIWLEERNRQELLAFVNDAIRFTRTTVLAIDEAPLQIYSSALAFAPSKSLVRQSYDKNVPSWLSVLPQVKEDWDACLLVIGCRERNRTIAFSNDSTMIASVPDSLPGTIKIWNTQTGKCRKVLEGHRGFVHSVVFSYDSTTVASTSNDKTVRIWNTKTGECEQILEGHSDITNSVVFLHNVQTVASASWDKTIRIWNIPTGECKQVLEGHTNIIMSVMFSHNSNKILSASYDHTIRIWNGQTRVCERVLKGYNNWAHPTVFSYDLKMVASASASHGSIVQIWNMQTGECEQALEGHSGRITSVAFSHNSRMVVSASSDDTIRIWNTRTWKCEQVLKAHSSTITSVAFSHDSRIVASGSFDNTIRIWDVQMGKSEQTLVGHKRPVWSIAISPSSEMAVSASYDGTLRIWNTQTGKCEQALDGHSEMVKSVAFSHNSMMVVSASSDHTGRIWNTQSGKCEQVLEGHTSELVTAVFSHNSKMVASASFDKSARIWNTQTGKCEQVLGHSEGVRLIVFSHDSKMLISASADYMLRVWCTQTGKCEKLFQGHTSDITSVVCSHDFQIMASGSYDKTIRIWDTQTGECKQTLEGHTGKVMSIILSYDSELVASVSRDTTARIWSTKTGRCEEIRYVDTCSISDVFEPSSWNVVVDDILSSSTNRPAFFESKTPSQHAKDLKLGLRNGTWITLEGKNLLWIPADFREFRQKVAIYANTVAIGYRSGKVLLLRFSAAQIAKL
ncbi:hypothetical protein PFICI_11316 [Pestalotiopsis fici W106-1]|uniref:Nephrocystin 3-like N-terminal domain-containing protein n=1 Tax=Pestalotiopsis fici (strain W106-1 / CGMCC3.15140) TaxID=1229662 RepID=W3WWE4_PESFW|nr:uncharacterized protein PFICI_11316 [Pestalotiopsis fici W106-1]ETS77442.1 hypothetical protein PFICI_11316 [Pestalotiopsis fici W106-1]